MTTAPRLLKPVLFVACLLPLAWLIAQAVGNRLGANPVEALTHATGLWALRLLLLTLAMTPLRRVTGWAWPLRVRRMLGLFAFGYVLAHFTVWLVLDRALDWSTVGEDIVKRPFITVGIAALVLLVPLAVTSTNGWMRRLGRRWKQLHRLVYVIAVLAVLHFLWLVKADLLEPGIYGALLAVLLVARLPWRLPRAAASAAGRPAGDLRTRR